MFLFIKYRIMPLIWHIYSAFGFFIKFLHGIPCWMANKSVGGYAYQLKLQKFLASVTELNYSTNWGSILQHIFIEHVALSDIYTLSHIVTSTVV